MTRGFHSWIWAKNVLWHQKHARARGWLHHAVGGLKRRVTFVLMTGISHCYAYQPRQETKLLAGAENTRHRKGCNTWLSAFKLLLSERDSMSAKQIQLLNTEAPSSSPGCFAEGYRQMVLLAKCWAEHTPNIHLFDPSLMNLWISITLLTVTEVHLPGLGWLCVLQTSMHYSDVLLTPRVWEHLLRGGHWLLTTVFSVEQTEQIRSLQMGLGFCLQLYCHSLIIKQTRIHQKQSKWSTTEELLNRTYI